MRENKKFKLHKALHIGAGTAILLIALCLLFSCSNSVPEYTVTFNLNGGSLDGETSPTKKVLEGALVSSLGEPVRDGYIFLGWYSDAEGESEYNLETPITGNLSLYAKWAKESVTITYSYYDLKAAETKGFKGGERVSSEDLSAPSDFTGGTFLGWYYESGTAFSAETQLIDDITLYPRWQDYTVYSSTYLVFSESGLRVWAEAAKNDPSLSCILLSDITLTSSNESENTWSPVGSEAEPYTGTFDGKNHTITGLKIIMDTDYLGFFGYIGSGGSVINLNLENVNLKNNIDDGGSIGAIAGYSKGYIESCTASGKVSASTSNVYIGGIVGYIEENNISKCTNSGEISLTSGFYPRVGGIAGGANKATISNSNNYGSINLAGNGEIYGGGIAGHVIETTVTSCFNSGNIAGKHNQNSSFDQTTYITLGAIVGYATNKSSIAECTVKDGCTINATYNSAYTLYRVDNYVGNVGAGTTVASSNSGEATIIQNDLNSTT